MRRALVLIPATAAAALFWCSCSKSEAINEPVRTYQIGERVNLSPLVYAVFEKQWATQFGAGNDARIPKARFYLIRVSITNNGNSTAFAPNMTLEDDAGGSCAELQDGDQTPHWIGYLRSVKPSDTIQGNVLFDCAPKHYKLKLTNEDGKTAYVDLPLSFDNGEGDVDVLQKDNSGEKLRHPK